MVTAVTVSPRAQLIDPKTGQLTRDGFLLLQRLNESVDDATSDFARVDAVQTLTNKTMDGDANSFSDLPTSALKTKTGDGTRVVTADAAGTEDFVVIWDADGNAANGKVIPDGALVGTSDTQTLTNKTLTAPVINSPTGIVKADVGLGNVDNTSDATKDAAVATLTNKTFGDAPIFPEFTVATLPTAADFDNGVIIVSDETGGRTLATSDGTNWCRVSDGATVS